MAQRTSTRKSRAGRKPAAADPGVVRRLSDRILEVVSRIPRSSQEPSKKPELESRKLVSRAARDAAAISGLLALPGGPMALLSIIPDLYAVWTRQAQLVADIAAVHGRTRDLTREMMLHCLFKHVSTHAAQDVLVRAGHRLLLRRAAGEAAARVCGRVTRSSLLRWLPIVGAAGMGAYAYYDTCQVGSNAMEAFRKA